MSELDMGMRFTDAGMDIPADKAWRFHSTPRTLQLQRRMILKTRLSRWLHRVEGRGAVIVLFCFAAVFALEAIFEAPIWASADVLADPPYLPALVRIVSALLTTTGVFVTLHFVNRDLFVRQIRSFDSMIIVVHGMGIIAIGIMAKSRREGDAYDFTDSIFDIMRGSAQVPVLILLATLDSIRMRNIYKSAVLFLAIAIVSYELGAIELGFKELIVRNAEVCSLGISCANMEAAYRSCNRSLAIFWLKALLMYVGGQPFAVIRPRFESVPLASGEQWHCPQVSSLSVRLQEFASRTTNRVFSHVLTGQSFVCSSVNTPQTLYTRPAGDVGVPGVMPPVPSTSSRSSARACTPAPESTPNPSAAPVTPCKEAAAGGNDAGEVHADDGPRRAGSDLPGVQQREGASRETDAMPRPPEAARVNAPNRSSGCSVGLVLPVQGRRRRTLAV